MKKLFSIVIAVLFTLSLLAQKSKKTSSDIPVPVFGKVDKADLEMRQCDFDEKAEALVLLDDGQLDHVPGTGFEFKRILRIKILSDKGLDWANVHLRYSVIKGDEEEIAGLEAQTYNLDNNGNVIISKVEKKLIYEKKLNKRYSEKVFTFPEVKVGSVIEYKFRHKNIGLVDWYFQRSIPVGQSRFVIDIPSELEISVQPYCSREYFSKGADKGGRTVKTYSMNNVPAFRDEPFILNEDFYRDRLETKIVAYPINGIRTSRIVNWQQVIKHLMEDEDFGVQLKKNIPRTAELDEKLKILKDPYKKMKTIYKYVQDNMQWNEYVGIWAFDGVKAAWKDKKGTVGEINLILTNLLKDADLDAHPVLVSTHDNGVVNTSDAGTYGNPGFNQFDRVMAFVEIDKKSYVLDATNKETPVHLFPSNIVMTEGMVIEKIETSEWGWRTLWNDNLLAKNIIQVVGEIDQAGTMTGQAIISSMDYARLDRLPTVKKGKDKFIEKYITGSNPGMTVEEVSFENQESDSLPLMQKIKFSQTLNSSGDYKYFSCNILSGLEKNPFLADNRFSDVFFGYNQSYQLIGNFTLPEGYELETPPKNIKMIMPDTSISITRVAQLTGDVLMTRVKLDFKKPFYPASQYSELQEFYKELFNLLNEQFVIRKKK
jgi:Domain of Unknown Function with PDB structure (DUF3857)